MPSSLKDSYENIKTQTKTPVWMFAGLALVAALIVVGVISEKQKGEKNSKLILIPQVGDIFEIKTKEGQYTLYKVGEVSHDSVFLQFHNYETNKMSGLNDLKKKGDNAYTEEMYGVSKGELKQMLDKDEIIDIDRK